MSKFNVNDKTILQNLLDTNYCFYPKITFQNGAIPKIDNTTIENYGINPFKARNIRSRTYYPRFKDTGKYFF